MRAARDAKGLKLTEIQVLKNPEEYDLIIIGTPIWWGNLTPAVRTYLKRYNLRGKKVAFFITSQGEDRENIFTQMSELTSESEIIGTFGILEKTVKNGGFTEQLNDFLKRLN
ncbi:MAG: flavodoxin family protein [Candidatus Hermodarchaeota archaeon]